MGRFRDTENKDYPTQFLVLVSILLTLITNSNSLDIRNVTKGTYATINCTYGEGEVRNLFWYAGNCPGETPTMPWIVQYFNSNVNSSDKPRFWLADDHSTLILKNVTVEDEGTYCCSVDIKSGVLSPYQFLTRVYVFGLDAKTLPVIRQCKEDDHGDLTVNSTTCTLNAPTSLTCELHGIYPNQSVKLEWHGDQGVISSISESYSNDDRTYTFLATFQVSEAGSFWCNASFPSEAGLVETGVLVTVTGLDAKTLPVIRQCQEDDHDDLNSTTCTLNAPTNLTCELHDIYPNRSVKLEWHDDQGVIISSISKSYSNDDMTYTFIATIQVSEAGSFWCNASFPTEAGLVETGVPVTVTMVTDPANQIKYVAIILPVVVAVAVVSVTVILVRRCVMRYRRGKDHTPTTAQFHPLMPVDAEVGNNTRNESESRVPDHADEQGRGNELRRQTEEATHAQSLPLMDEARNNTLNDSESREPDHADEQGRGNEQRRQTEEATPRSHPLMPPSPEAENNTPNDSESRVPDHADEQGRGNEQRRQTEEEIQHSTNESQCNIKIKDGQFIELSKKFPHQQYTNLCAELHLSYEEGQSILEQKGNNFKEAVTAVLMKWKNKTGGVCHVLCSALDKAEVGGTLKPLIHITAVPGTTEA